MSSTSTARSKPSSHMVGVGKNLLSSWAFKLHLSRLYRQRPRLYTNGLNDPDIAFHLRSMVSPGLSSHLNSTPVQNRNGTSHRFRISPVRPGGASSRRNLGSPRTYTALSEPPDPYPTPPTSCVR